MIPQWFLARNKARYGPYSINQLKEMAASGQLLPSDMLLLDGTQQWVPACFLYGLFCSTELAAKPIPQETSSTVKPDELGQLIWIYSADSQIIARDVAIGIGLLFISGTCAFSVHGSPNSGKAISLISLIAIVVFSRFFQIWRNARCRLSIFDGGFIQECGTKKQVCVWSEITYLERGKASGMPLIKVARFLIVRKTNGEKITIHDGYSCFTELRDYIEQQLRDYIEQQDANKKVKQQEKSKETQPESKRENRPNN